MLAGRKRTPTVRYPAGIGPRQPFAFIPGWASTSAGKVLFLSLSNAPVALACNGATYQSGVDFVLSPLGTDAPLGHPWHGSTAAWAGVIDITGLPAAFTPYPLEVQQGAHTLTGTLTTAPRAGDTFSLYFASCFNNTTLGGVPGGFFADMRAQLLNPHLYNLDARTRCAGVLFYDDLGYFDGTAVDDTRANGTGHVFSAAGGGSDPSDTELEYDYLLGILALLGLLGEPDLTGALTTAQKLCAFGRDMDWLWCSRNLNWFFGWGDHDAGDNEMGWDINASTSNAFSVASGLWDKTFGAIAPTSIANRDAGARHWAHDLGDLRIVAIDGITNGDAVAGSGRQLFGNNQIDDCLDAAASAHQWKLLPMMYSIRYLAAAGGVRTRGAQNPIEGLTEYKRLFTRTNYAADPASLMASNATNGSSGVLVSINGDYHWGLVTENHKPAYTDNAAEAFYSLHLGTINGSFNFGVEASIVTGLDYLGETEVKWVQVPESGIGQGEHKYHGLRLIVDGARGLRAEHWNQYRALNWAGDWQPGSNLPV